MASSSDPLNEELQCSICLDVFTDPVTTPCGHNFCRTCLNKFCTNTETCFCPTCKETFSRNPDPKINKSRGGLMGGEVRMIQRDLVREGGPGTQPLLRGTNQPLLLRMGSLPRGTNKPPVPLPRFRSLRRKNEPLLTRMQPLPRAQVDMLFRGPRNHSGDPEYNAESVVQHFKEKLNLGRSEVFCDICDERKQKAVKSCLTCQSSYCETHLEPHHKVSCLKKHKLINAVENLEDYICQKHQRPLELFCRDDQTCVCLSCTEGDHRTHNTVPIEEEIREKLVQKKTDMQQMIQNRVKKIQEIQHSAELRKNNTEKEKSTSVELFTDLIRSMKRCQSKLLKMMEEQQKAAEKQAEDLIKELQQEITDLKKRNTELEQLSHTDDHLHLLQMYSSLNSHPHTKNWTEISIDTDVNVLPLHRALTQLKKTHKALNKKLSQTGLSCVQKYAVDVTLDPDTAHRYLILSDDGKQVSHGDIEQNVPENPKRFDVGLSVLAKEGFSSGRFYYEVQVKGKTQWSVGVARESINRNGGISPSPEDGLWSMLSINQSQYIACDNQAVAFSHRETPEIVGVFVDYEEGLVSFYDVGSSSHIYSFTGQTFTEKLHPYFGPGLDDGRKNPLIISPVS